MAFTYGFYNSKGGDRKYNADQMGNLFDGILNDGVFDNVGNIFATVPGEGLQVLVKSGRAWFNKTWSYNDAAYPIYLERPDVAVPRIDAIVLEVDRRETHRRNRIGYIVGIPDSTPKKPTLTNTDLIHQHPLAYVTVRAGTESILHSDIEIRVGQSDCPFVTGILKTASIDDLFAAWNEQFTTWFDGVKSQLEGDVAANLLREIQLRLPIADKATSSEVGAGTVDNKYITPKQLAPHLGKIKDSVTGQIVSVSLKNGYLRPRSFMYITNKEMNNTSGYISNTSIVFGYNNCLAIIAIISAGWRLFYMTTSGTSSITFTKRDDMNDGSINSSFIYRRTDTSVDSAVIGISVNSVSRYYIMDISKRDMHHINISAVLSDYIITNIEKSGVYMRRRGSSSDGSAGCPISMSSTPYFLGDRMNTLIVIVNGGGSTYYVHNFNITGTSSMTVDANKITLTMNSNHMLSSTYPQIGNFAFVVVSASNKYLACPVCINCNTYSHNYSQTKDSELVDFPPSVYVGGTKVIFASKSGSETLCYIVDFKENSTTMRKIKYAGSIFDGVNGVGSSTPNAITSLRLGNGDAAFINSSDSIMHIIDDNLNISSIPCFFPMRSTSQSNNEYYTRTIQYASASSPVTEQYGRVTIFTLDTKGPWNAPLLTSESDKSREPHAAYSVKIEKMVTG